MNSLPGIPVKNHPILLLILGVLNPIKLTGGVHVSHTKEAYYGVGLIAPPLPPQKIKVLEN
jgi:hypothetical protein